VVAALIAFPAAAPASALANSAFDQYVETPPDSGSQNPGNNAVTPGGGPGKPGSTAGGQDGSGSSAPVDPMVAWATGQAPAAPSGSTSGTGGSNPPESKSTGVSDPQTASPMVATGSLEAISADSGQAPMLLIVLMVLSAAFVAGFALLRKRQHN